MQQKQTLNSAPCVVRNRQKPTLICRVIRQYNSNGLGISLVRYLSSGKGLVRFFDIEYKKINAFACRAMLVKFCLNRLRVFGNDYLDKTCPTPAFKALPLLFIFAVKPYCRRNDEHFLHFAKVGCF